jgi:hypothetical protein
VPARAWSGPARPKRASTAGDLDPAALTIQPIPDPAGRLPARVRRSLVKEDRLDSDTAMMGPRREKQQTQVIARGAALAFGEPL